MYVNSMYTDLSKKERKISPAYPAGGGRKKSPPQTEMGNVILLLCFVNFRLNATINQTPGVRFPVCMIGCQIQNFLQVFEGYFCG